MPSFLGHPRIRVQEPSLPMYVTWNGAGTDSNISLSNGSLTGEVTGPTAGSAYGMSATTGYNLDDGKRYIEITVNNVHGELSGIALGFADTDQIINGHLGDMTYAYAWRLDGYKESNGIAVALGSAASNGDVIQLAIDAYLDSGAAKARIWFGKNGLWFGGGNPALATAPAFDGVIAPIATDWGVRATMKTTGDRMTGNFGAAPFVYGVPTGFGAGWGANIT